jgi:hypothetical protein
MLENSDIEAALFLSGVRGAAGRVELLNYKTKHAGWSANGDLADLP